jgi:putative transposase
MAGFTFRKHMVFDWDGTEYKILELPESGQIVLENVENHLLDLQTKDHLLSEYTSGKITAKSAGKAVACAALPVFSRPLDEITERDRLEMQRRKHYLDVISSNGTPIFTHEYLKPLIGQAAVEINDIRPPGQATVYRWYCRYRRYYDTWALIPRYDLRGSRKLKQSELLLKITAEAIEEAYKQSPLSSGEDVYVILRGKICEENSKRLPNQQLKSFSKRTLYRYIQSADVYELIQLKEGKTAADRRLRVVLQGAKTNHVLERVEIDHTPLDLFLVDERTGLPLGRPTLTVVIDHYSRMLLGYYLTFGSPSTAAVMGALRHAILPKSPTEEAIPNLKINNPWPCYGVPDLMVVDNGLEFHGNDLESVAFDLNIRIQYCPKKQPRFKGTVERYLKTINYSFVNQFPGVSFAKYDQRGDYDPLKCAVLTMAEFKHTFEKWVLDIYSQDLHGGIGRTPWSRWQESIAKKPPELPIDLHTLQRRIGLVTERKLQTNGILLNSIRYNCHVLAPILNAYGAAIQVRVLYDTEDLGEIQVWGPDQPEPITVQALEYEYAKGLTLKQHEYLRMQFLEQGKATFNEEELLKAKYELKQVVSDMMGSRKHKNRKRGAALAGITSDKPNGSQMMLEQQKNEKPIRKPTATKKRENADDVEPPPLLPTFQMKSDPEDES